MSGVLQDIRAAGGEVIGITSEPDSLAREAEAAWQIDMPIVGDPHHEIRKDLKNRGWLDIYHNEDSGHLRERKWADHPHGYYQPAVIAVDQSSKILYRWRCVPKFSNMSGAGQGRKPCILGKRCRQPCPNNSMRRRIRIQRWARRRCLGLNFLLLLLAHGWFIRPRAFPLLRDGGKGDVSPSDAMRRVYIFVGLWLLALLLLPGLWVVLAAVIWAIAVTPGLIEIHRQFQNEPEPY